MKAKLIMLLALLAVMSTNVLADDDDKTMTIDGKIFHVLKTTNDWERFRKLVQEAAGLTDVNAVMDENIDITTAAL